MVVIGCSLALAGFGSRSARKRAIRDAQEGLSQEERAMLSRYLARNSRTTNFLAGMPKHRVALGIVERGILEHPTFITIQGDPYIIPTDVWAELRRRRTKYLGE